MVQGGFALFRIQLIAMLKKNFIVWKRNYTAAIVQILAPFFMILLVFAIDQSQKADQALQSRYQNSYAPVVHPVRHRLPCLRQPAASTGLLCMLMCRLPPSPIAKQCSSVMSRFPAILLCILRIRPKS